VTEPISGTVTIGVIGPTGGGIVGASVAGIVDGMSAFYEKANRDDLVPGVAIELVVVDDSGDPTVSDEVLADLLAGGVDLISGSIGTPTNAVIRQPLNEQCVPHLFAISPAAGWDAIIQNPWTTGGSVSVAVETRAMAANATTAGATTFGVLFADNELGRSYRDGFAGSVGDADAVVVEQPINAAMPIVDATSVAILAAARPQAVLLAPVSAGCASALVELEKLVSDEWRPRVYMSQSCLNRLTIRLAGSAADGVYTITDLIDVGNLANVRVAAVAELAAALPASSSPVFLSNAATGWNIAELTVDVLARAAASDDGLNRRTIIEAARSLDTSTSLGFPGVHYVTDGSLDAAVAETVQVVRWNEVIQAFDPDGALFEG
jgi:ABC-type branched-subunit amino acid transport system substrate-binding protein